jgi:hypothetical protein
MFFTGSLFGPVKMLPRESVFTGPTNCRNLSGDAGPTGAMTWRVKGAERV